MNIRLQRIALVAAGVVLAFLAGVLFTFVFLDRTGQRFGFLYDDFTIDSCLSELDSIGQDSADVAGYDRSVAFCYNKIVRQGQVNDFLIRRVNFQNQHVADNVIMWMVVVLTLSGVVLAAVQLVMPSKLFGAQAAVDSEFSVEKGKIFLRSSVTGLFILLISFGFFYTYIIFVYQIFEVDPDASNKMEPKIQTMLPRLNVPGGLGPPPDPG